MRRIIEIPLYERFLIRLNRFLAYRKFWTRSTFAAPTFSLFVIDSINNQSYSRKEIVFFLCLYGLFHDKKSPMEIKCRYSAKCSWAFCAIAIKSVVWKPTFRFLVNRHSPPRLNHAPFLPTPYDQLAFTLITHTAFSNSWFWNMNHDM